MQVSEEYAYILIFSAALSWFNMETLTTPPLQLRTYQKVLYMNNQDRQDSQYTYNVTLARWRIVDTSEDVGISLCSRPALQPNLTADTIAEIKR